jgi:hypothetical protein
MVLDGDDLNKKMHILQAVDRLQLVHRRQLGHQNARYRAGRVLRIRPGDCSVVIVVGAGWAEGAALCKKLV